MTSPTRAWALCRLSDYRAFQCRARGTTASTRCGGLTAIGRARAWLAATWLESGWLNPRSATWLQTMGSELRPSITTT